MSPSRVWIHALLRWSFLAVFAFAAFGSPRTWASASTIADSASCMALLPGATWDGTTCTIPPGASISVASELRIAPGVAVTNSGSLTVTAAAAITNGGVFTNLGAIVVQGRLTNSAPDVSASASMVNAGSIVVLGALANSCIATPGAPFAVCRFDNKGTITVSSGGFLGLSCDNWFGCLFFNTGLIENAGDFNVECLVIDKCPETIASNQGYVHNAATGTIRVLWSAFFENGGGFDGGTLDNDGHIEVADAPDSYVVVDGGAAFQNFNGGAINNHGTIFLAARLASVKATITNFGTITASPGAIGYLVNGGQILEMCDAVLTLVVFSGDPVINECFDATATAIAADPQTIAPSSMDPIAITVTMTNTTSPYPFPPRNGNVVFTDYGAGGYFIGSSAEGGDPCNRLSASTFRCEFPLVPVSGTASQLQVQYLPAPALGGPNLTPGSTITLTATYDGDAQHGSSTGTTTVNVLKDPRTLLLQLATQVSGVGPGHSLSAKIAAALAYLAAGDTADLQSVLTAFVNEVNAQTGKTISADIAAQLIAAVQQIRQLIA